jgi:hypothetical protein
MYLGIKDRAYEREASERKIKDLKKAPGQIESSTCLGRLFDQSFF